MSSDGFKALADPARLQILDLLSSGSRCVCELEVEMSCASNLLAYHLGILKQAGFVRGTKQGRRTHYELLPEALDTMRDGLGELLRRAGHEA